MKKKKMKKKYLDFFFYFQKSGVRKENVRYPDRPDFENLQDFWTRGGVC